jgi:NAD(P)H-dependent FMN reductase
MPQNIALTTIDLADYPMPISPSGTTIPARLSLPLEPAPYDDEEVNRWSHVVRELDAFVFLTPQYNWSFPATIKVAFDHLFHEWKGKPMVVVSYGGHGGGKCNAAMQEVWKGLRGGECAGALELALGGGEGMGRAQREGVLDDMVRKVWETSGKDKEVAEAWAKLVALLEGEGPL